VAADCDAVGECGPTDAPWLLRLSTTDTSYFGFFSRTSANEPTVLQHTHNVGFVSAIPGDSFIVARGQWCGYTLLTLVTGEEGCLPYDLWGDVIPNKLSFGVGPSSTLLILATIVSPDLTPNRRFLVVTLGHHKAMCWCLGMDCWELLEPHWAFDSKEWKRIMLDEFEDLIY
jgi:hypothetical protein